ncbi:MAG: hypothetical protein NUV57_05485 [archaeon]|nr:hypothetical protein [archaeon]
MSESVTIPKKEYLELKRKIKTLENLLEPELRPEYKQELERIEKGNFKKFSSVEDLKKELEHA